MNEESANECTKGRIGLMRQQSDVAVVAPLEVRGWHVRLDIERRRRGQQGGGTMARFGTVGFNLGTAGRWSRFGLGLLIAAGTTASTLLGFGPARVTVAFLVATTLACAGIAAAYLVVYALLGERVFARANPWLNTLVLVGPALTIASWNLTLGATLGVDLPAALTLAMLVYVGASLVLESFIGYGGCEVVALPILVWRRRYVTYCLPLVLVDRAERGWLESAGARRLLWIALGGAAVGTILLGLFGIAPVASSLAFLVVVALVTALTLLERRRDARPGDLRDESPDLSAG
jgi:hypothetical protein